jgi:N-acetylglucosaminyl-diphospho-decaprenol L-rhamnosyltransferase
MKLSIVIVSWNVRELLQKCLESLFLYGLNTEQEICIVDNASADGSADMVRQEFPHIACIINDDNRGFAVACNQGIAATSGEYILFLNPDSAVTSESIGKLVTFLDENSHVGMVAPRLLDSDGTVQPSVRKFPRIWDSLAMFFQWKPREYTPVDTTSIEQPMGACMLVRRSVLQKVGPFDEKFYLWFEEVDLCKRIKDAGFDIVYLPTAHIVHIGGRSFGQRGLFDKQKIFYTSFSYYLWKHFGWKAFVPVSFMKLYVSLLTYPFIWIPIGAVLCAELISYAGYFSESFHVAGFWIFFAAALIAGLRKLSYGFYFLVIELLVGSKGYLLSASFAGFEVSLRMAFFTAVFFAWFIHILRGFPRFSFFRSPLAPWYGLLGGVFIWGVLNGVLSGNVPLLIFKDANAWLFFLLVIPLYDAFHDKKEVVRLFQVALAGLSAHIVKVFCILYVMSHQSFGYDIVYPFYRWIRETGVGEITRFEWGGVRVFLQSSIYAVIGLFFAVPLVARVIEGKKIVASFRQYGVYMFLLSGMAGALLLSYSRSFWFATALLGIMWFGIGLLRKQWTVLKVSLAYISAMVVGVVAIMVVSFFPLPSADGGLGLDAFTKRLEDLDSEAAAASRWSLLPVLGNVIAESPLLGHGFGKTVTYESFDPRVRESQKTGSFTTYAFEWGYLDTIVKMGAGGLLALILFLGVLIKRGVSTLRATGSPIVNGLLLGFAVLLLVHVFTPYLNHPLGIAYIIFSGFLFDFFRTKNLGSHQNV